MSRADLVKIRARLAALRAKTTANGCTEAEALAAAEKAAELMEAHDLTEVDLEAPDFDEGAVTIGGRRTPLDSIWPSVARFAHCTGYLDRANSRWRFVYFGRPGDVLIAEYVHEVIKRAAETSIATFKATEDYRRRRTAKTRTRALKAFAEGFAASMAAKLHAGLWRRLEARGRGTAAIVVKATDDLLRAELARRGLRLSTATALSPSEGKFRDRARFSGYRAGNDVSVEAGVAAPAEPLGGLLQ